ncbi:hypothetical protein [Streptomyces goshikiensis]|uniref:hypothetical protein n=1 Tax=Streptomyces goshikiensis TaxID=1942 RepID=UPI002ADFFE25|nr:hypothetical protein [Streptomyces goshikiensis]
MTRTPKQPVWYMATPADGIIERSRGLSPVSLADAVGQAIDHPTPCANRWFDETPHSYFRMVKRVGEVLEDTRIRPVWPVRLWVVEPLGETGNWGQRYYPYRLLSHRIRVVEETDARQALGARGRDVLDAIDHQLPRLAPRWAADWDADPEAMGRRRETWRLSGGPDTTSGMKAESLADDAARARRESAAQWWIRRLSGDAADRALAGKGAVGGVAAAHYASARAAGLALAVQHQDRFDAYVLGALRGLGLDTPAPALAV